MKAQTQKEICPYGRKLLLNLLQAFEAEIAGAQEAKDIEHVHQLRVSSRRLRSAFPLFQVCLPNKQAKSWLNQIRHITGSLGHARDLDVQIDFLEKYVQTLEDKRYEPGIRRIILRLNQQRQMTQSDVVHVLSKLEQKNTLQVMKNYLESADSPGNDAGSYPISLYRLAYKAISKRLKTYLSYDQFVHLPDCIKELHEMRIAAKELRYTMEIFAPIYLTGLRSSYQVMRKTQDLLGAIHDCDVWINFIPDFIQAEKQRTLDFYGQSSPYHFLLPGLANFLQDRQAERERIYANFRKEWEKWKSEAVWDSLLANIQMPTYPRDAIATEETDQPNAPDDQTNCPDC